MPYQMTLEQILGHAFAEDQSRRRFLRTAALGLATIPFAARADQTSVNTEAFEARQPRSTADSAGPSSIVGCARHPKVLEEGRPACKRMLDAAMMSLTGKKTPNEAWREFFSPKDVVGLKMNGLGGPGISNNPELTDMVVKSLVDAGVPESHIILWDNTARHVRNCGYELNEPGSAPRVWCGNDAGYSEEMEFPSGKTKLTRIVTQYTTAIINMPILKDHVGAGVTLSLKNMSHGATSNPGALHGNNCDPYIAEVCALEPIRKRWRLSILDGLRGVWDGGPGLKPHKSWYPQSIWVSSDPVALDTVCCEVIEAKRAESGERSLAESGRPPKHIRTAERIGLGVGDRARIRLVQAEVA